MTYGRTDVEVPASASPEAQPRQKSSRTTKVERFFCFLSDVVVFSLLRVAQVQVQWDVLRNRQVPRSTPSTAPVRGDHAEFLYKVAREDSAATDGKVKQLLTLSTSLAALATIFGRNVAPKLFLVLFVLALVATVVLCLSVLEVRSAMAPSLDDKGKDPDDITWGMDVYQSYRSTREVHNVRTDRYRASLRYFRAALVMLLLAVSAPGVFNAIPAIQSVIRQACQAPSERTTSSPTITPGQRGDSGLAIPTR